MLQSYFLRESLLSQTSQETSMSIPVQAIALQLAYERPLLERLAATNDHRVINSSGLSAPKHNTVVVKKYR